MATHNPYGRKGPAYALHVHEAFEREKREREEQEEEERRRYRKLHGFEDDNNTDYIQTQKQKRKASVKWSTQEDDLLIDYVNKHGHMWKEASEYINSMGYPRNREACRKRYRMIFG